VSEKRQSYVGACQCGQRVLKVDDVTILIVGSAMDELHVGKIRQCNRPMRQFPQPRDVVSVEVITVPQSRQSSHGIEALDVVNSRNRFVVISAYEHFAQAARAGSDFVRAGAVSDHIAKVEDAVVGRRSSQTCLQCFEIAVYVAE
jgi:hypothetical protein